MDETDFLITYRDYELSGSSVIFRLFGRDSNGQRVVKHISGTKPYLYVPDSEQIISDSRIKDIQVPPIDSIFHDKLKQIFVSKPGDVAGRNENITYIRDMYEKTFEADILYDYRCAIDFDLNGIVSTPKRPFLNVNDIKPSQLHNIETRKFTFDVENEDNGTIADAKAGKKEVYVITVHDSKTDTYYIFTSYTLSNEEKEKIRKTIYEHWINNKYYPEFSEPILKYVPANNEVGLFENFFNLFQQEPPDILAGYNSNDYDIPVVCNRAKELNVDYRKMSEVKNVNVNFGRPRISGVACMDIQLLYKEFQQGTVLYPSLNYVSQKELETEKLPRTSIIELYQTDKAHLVAYNIIDVQLTVGVEKKNSLIDYFNEINIESYTSFEETNRSVFIDNLILKEVSGECVLPTKREVQKSGMRGGLVYDVISGMHFNVIVVDFAGMYPSIIIALNLSKETKHPDGDIVAANGIRFMSKPEGIIPRILKKLKKKRKFYKIKLKDAKLQGEHETKEFGKITPTTAAFIKQYDLKQYAIKVLMNAFYGVMNFKWFRLADAEMGDAITSTGQYLSLGCKTYIEKNTFHFDDKPLEIEVIYGDTDSLFIKVIGDFSAEELQEISKLFTSGINEEINRIMKEEFNVIEHDIEIEDDKIFKSLFQVPSKSGEGAKKRYVGLTYVFDENNKCIDTKEVVKGFEIVRSSSAQITKDVQRHILFDLILKDVKRFEIRKYLLQLEEDFFNKKIPQADLGIRVPLNKPMNQYGNLETINALRNAKHYLKKDIDVGYIGTFYKVSKSPIRFPRHDVIALDFDEELPEGYELNYEDTWTKEVVKPLETILEAYNMSWDYVKTGKVEKPALSFFNGTTTKIPEIQTPNEMEDVYIHESIDAGIEQTIPTTSVNTLSLFNDNISEKEEIKQIEKKNIVSLFN